MSKNHKKGKHSQSNNRSKLTTRMEVEFGSEFVGDAKRAAQAVETRVKNNALRYGFGLSLIHIFTRNFNHNRLWGRRSNSTWY